MSFMRTRSTGGKKLWTDVEVEGITSVLQGTKVLCPQETHLRTWMPTPASRPGMGAILGNGQSRPWTGQETEGDARKPGLLAVGRRFYCRPFGVARVGARGVFKVWRSCGF
jgi:hypothetical protein